MRLLFQRSLRQPSPRHRTTPLVPKRMGWMIVSCLGLWGALSQLSIMHHGSNIDKYKYNDKYDDSILETTTAARRPLQKDKHAQESSIFTRMNVGVTPTPTTPTRTKPIIKEDYDDPTNSFAACLLFMDDNHFLIEWLAYHYHVLVCHTLSSYVCMASVS
jgi:hypothetical protein